MQHNHALEPFRVMSDSETSSSASVGSSTQDRGKAAICQNCMALTKKNTANWCRTNEEWTARKHTCEYFRRKKK